MSLDWSPMAKPKPGHEREWLELHDAIEEEWQDALVERFRALSIPPFESLDAPIVGTHPAADEWARQSFASGRAKVPTVEEYLARMKGYRVLELMPPCDGFPHYTNAGLHGLDRYSFRASYLRDAAAVLGEALMNRAYECMPHAHQLQRYGEELQARGAAYAREHDVEHVRELRSLDHVEAQTPPSIAHIVFSAAKWCLFWAKRGHGLEPWF